MNDRPPVRKTPRNGAPASRTSAAARRRALERYRKNQRRRKLRYAVFFVSRVLLFYAVLVLLAALIFLAKINSFPKSKTSARDVFVVSVVQEEFSDIQRGTLLRKENIAANGTEYVPVSVLSEYGSVSEGGDLAARTLYIGDGYACFEIGTGAVKINGGHTYLKSPSIIRNGELCVPTEFFERCLSGVNVTLDEANDRYTLTKTGKLDFVMREQTAEEALSYEDLALKIRIEREKLGIAQ